MNLHLISLFFFLSLRSNFKKHNIMKELKRIGLCLAIITAALLISCSKDDNKDPSTADSTTSIITAKIDGVDFSSKGVSLIVDFNDNVLQFLGANATGQVSIQASLEMNSTVLTTGTYNLGSSNEETEYFGDLGCSVLSGSSINSYSSTNCDDTTGTLTINSISSTKITGTFSFKGKDFDCNSTTKNVTNGTFVLIK